MLRKVLLPAVALSLITGATALAQDGPDTDKPAVTLKRGEGEHGRMFSRLDADGDGIVGTEEFGGERLEALKTADTDRDGTLSQEELVAYAMKREFERRAERMAGVLDIDGDGGVTLAEIESHRDKRFALMDRNDDGELSEDELGRAAEGVRAMRGRGMEGGPRFAMRRGGHGPERFKDMRFHRMAPMTTEPEPESAPAEE